MKSYKQFVITESGLTKGQLSKDAGKGPYVGTSRFEILADLILKKKTFPMVDGKDTLLKPVFQVDGEEKPFKTAAAGKKILKDFGGKTIKVTTDGTTWISTGKLRKTAIFGGAGAAKSINIQELLVAALVLHGKQIKIVEAAEADALIKILQKIAPRVVGHNPKHIPLFEGSYHYLAQAISTSNKILSHIKGDKVYVTGNTWHKDIQHLNPVINGMKNYNSSDIIVRSGKRFFGYSLKAKAKRNALDPTLINKAVTGNASFLKGIISSKELAAIEGAKDKFFAGVAEKEGKPIKKISNKVVNGYLKSGDNIFFKEMYKIISSNADDFIKSFLNLVFKVDLADMVKTQEFQFYVLTGIGRMTGKGIVVEEPVVIDLPNVMEILSVMFDSKKLKLGKTVAPDGSTRKQAYEGGSSAAKLFYTIYHGKDSIITIEIRYKGSFTSNPQLMASVTPNFKNLF